MFTRSARDELPSEALSTALDALRSAQARQRPIILITSGTAPRVCVPDSGELRVLDGSLRVAIWPDTPVAADLDAGASVLLVVPATADVHLIQATARQLANAAMVWTHYDLTITSTRIVAPGTAPYAQSKDPNAEVLAIH